jgi:hypothetical protein
VPGPAGPKAGDVLRVFGVVEDKQPPVPVAQRGQQSVDGVGHRGPGGQAQPGGEGAKLSGDEQRLFGVDPPHQLVVGGETVRVLERQLGLAHPAQPVQRLHHQRRFLRAQPPVELGEQVVPAGEMRIAGRHSPQERFRNGGGWERRVDRNRGRGPFGRRAPIQARVLGEDGGLKLLQRRARVDAQLLGQGLAGPSVGLQRLGLPAGAVQGQHEQPVQPLVQRMPGDEGLQLADELGVAPEGQIGLQAGLQGAQP